MNTRFKFKAVLLAALLILGAAQTSQAILSAVGPTDPGNGFPLWYQDANSVALVPCFSGALSPNVAPPVAFPDINMTIMCVLAAEPGFASLPVIFPTNFPTEFFYYIADNDKLTSPAALKIARFALEGTFANLPTVPVDGQQTIFTRVRFTIDPAGGGASPTYVITHPFGTTTLGPANLAGALYKFTEDIPVGIPLDFTGALNGNIGPFLKWDAGVPIVVGTEQFIGDPNIPHRVIGSPLGRNWIQIEGPNINPGLIGLPPVGVPPGTPPANVWRGDLFLVAGKLFNGALPAPLIAERASYSRNAAGAGQVDVFAHSAVTAFVDAQAVGTPLPPELVPPHALITDGVGSFFAHIPVTSLTPVPTSVTVTSVLAGATTTTVGKPVTDLVSISSAQYDNATGTLTISATSSDLAAPLPTLTAGIYGPMVTPATPGNAYTLTVPALLVPTATVTVSSSAGGQDTHPVNVIGLETATNPNPPIITTTALPNASTGSAYSFQVTALDNAGAGLTFSTPTAGLPGALPPGLSISATGLISGTVPVGTPPATFNVMITVTDGVFPVSTPLPGLPLTVTSFVITSAVPPPPFLLGVPYGPLPAVTTTGGTAPFTYSLTGAPAGVTISGTGVISGTPTTVGPFSATITVTAAGGLTATQIFSGTVTVPPLSINAIANRTVNVNAALAPITATAVGGVTPRTFIGLLGAPPGVTISAAGVISGTPTATGVFPITVTVRDSAVPAVQAIQTFTLTVVVPPETITVTLSETTRVTTTTRRWRAQGTSTLTAGNTITVYLGDAATGTRIGSGVVQADGRWSVAVNLNFGQGVNPAPGTAVSTFGTQRTFNWIFR